MRRNLPLFFVGSSIFAFFVFFSYLVHKDVFTSFDFDTTVRLQDNIPRRFDEYFSLLSTFGNFELMLVVLLVLLVVRRKIIGGIACFAAFVLFHFIELYGKFFVEHPPPPEFMVRTESPIEFPQFYVRSEFSYPSGHAGRTAFLSVLFIVLILRSRRMSTALKLFLIAAIVLFAIGMFVTRVYLGEHWSSDVIGGVLLGGAMSLVSAVFL